MSVAACALCGVLAMPASQAFGATSATPNYTKESTQAYAQQLASGQIAEAVINKRIRTIRITLKSGEHVKARYQAHEEPKVVAALKAKGVPVRILTPAEAKAEASKSPVHHKLRYIAGGILIAVIVIVGAVLLWDRRRKRLAE
jgi:hypothetical protein